MLAAKDVSGSITPAELGEIDAEEAYFWDVLKPVRLRSMTFDVKIHQNRVFTEGDILEPSELAGGGGTNVSLILKYIREEDPVVSLIFTDGHFSMPSLEDIYTDIFWIVKGNRDFDPPHGVVIHLE